LTHLRVKVHGNEVGFFVADDKRLCQVEAARLVDASNPPLVDIRLKAPAKPTVSLNNGNIAVFYTQCVLHAVLCTSSQHFDRIFCDNRLFSSSLLRSIVMSTSVCVCLFVCLSISISPEPHSQPLPNFYTCWPWLGPPLAG